MTIIQSILLGIIQGITEFLPISSSAHLVLIPHLLGWELNSEFVFPFDVLVQLGTLTAVIIYYRDDLIEIIKSVQKGIKAKKPFTETPARVGWLAILATIPSILAGVLFKDQIKAAFNNPTITSLFLFGTAGLLIIGEFLGKKSKELEEIQWLDTLWIGVFQAVSVFPGISRSGSSITGGLTRNFDRKSSGQFAFLMAIPVLLAAGLLGILELIKLPNLAGFIPEMVIGFISAGVVGYFAIRWLLGYISSHSLLPFAGYCLILGAGSLLLAGYSPASRTVEAVAEQPPVISISDTYKVSIDPNLEWLLPAMNACQKQQPGLQILFQQKVFRDDLKTDGDLFIMYGEEPGISDTVYQLGLERFQIVANPSSGLTSVTPDLASQIFSGNLKTWGEIVQRCEDCFSSIPITGEIRVYVFPPDSLMFEFMKNVFPTGFNVYSAAFIAPNAKAIRESVSREPFAIGILPGHWVDESVQILYSQTQEFLITEIPVLAYPGNNFDAILESWLICVQNRIG
ncbi:MAG TPA: undecaprenyl-diphosphatase UppP [Pelolinea sp.]|nr:undecaprenyl-diphosphatase UppP [Pelolinea sp.]